MRAMGSLATNGPVHIETCLSDFCRDINLNRKFIFRVDTRFFTVCTKLAEMALLASKDLRATIKVTSSVARADARYYYRFKSQIPN